MVCQWNLATTDRVPADRLPRCALADPDRFGKVPVSWVA